MNCMSDLIFFQKPKTCTHNLTHTIVSSTCNSCLNKLFEVRSHGNFYYSCHILRYYPLSTLLQLIIKFGKFIANKAMYLLS